MTHEVSTDTDSTLQEHGAVAEKPAQNGVGIPVSDVLSMLVDGADIEDVLRAFPGLTRHDLQMLLADAVAREEALARNGDEAFISPQDFYREAVQREDIRRILAALAK